MSYTCHTRNPELRTFRHQPVEAPIGPYRHQLVQAPTRLGTQIGMYRHHVILFKSVIFFHRFNHNNSVKCVSFLHGWIHVIFQNVDIYSTGTSFICVLRSKCLWFTCTFQFYLLIQNTCLPMYVKFLVLIQRYIE